ncbi:LysR family transcriptional regulator [Aquincola sp. J276]|uniref:LysR family transcriptional regulator n=1 Tax=Aquincola sp. J276 TaxID=2898432 RepID=UPI002150EA32|nr:LysR family transcriptional regulator [Aquincola sp. J276]MCR5864961.1 LysR family transcriptional regulator [Aquincola sp. J276]
MTTTSPDQLWAHVHCLGALAEAGSYTAAAARLQVSKAAVSQRITELERAAGVPLVQRTTRSVRLTPAGQQLVDQTRGAYEQIQRSFASVRDLAATPSGVLRITAPVALGRQYIAPALAGFHRAFPSVRVDLELSDRLVPLSREGFDLAVRHTHTPPDDHVAWKLCDSRTLLVASADYLDRRGLPEHPSALAGHDALAYLRPGPSIWQFERQAQAAAEPERIEVTVHGPFRANNSEVLRDAVIDGLGIALLPDFSAAAALGSGRLRVVLPDWRPVGFFGDAIHAIRPWSPHTPRAVHEVVECLRRALAPGFALP